MVLPLGSYLDGKSFNENCRNGEVVEVTIGGDDLTQENGDGELIGLMYVLMQPTRRKIIKALRAENPDPLYIEEIAERIGLDRRNVSFHLATLAKHGFVEGEFRSIEALKSKSRARGKAGKFFRLTDKVDEVLAQLSEAVS